MGAFQAIFDARTAARSGFVYIRDRAAAPDRVPGVGR